jgi:hypothetical protein
LQRLGIAGSSGQLVEKEIKGGNPAIPDYDEIRPRPFDSPSVFGAILDADNGGRFRIAPAHGRPTPQAVLLAGHQRPGQPLPAP